MNTYIEYWSIGSYGGIGNTIDDINRYAQHHNAEIVGIAFVGNAYAQGQIVVVFKEGADNERN